MKPSSLLSFSLALLLLQYSLAEADFQKTCTDAANSDSQADHDFCVSRLLGRPDSIEVDTWRLAQIAAELAINNNDIGKVKIGQLSAQATDATLRQLLNTCYLLFDGMGRADA
ncbi:hypothetical protein Cni_G14331 [Canna indica]|uniref:Pectinesterase inhibitor domain-containing protein n=1 Tax=Canna indica TaxID=4628 RepID=A0AAQ3KBP9_9LILI|nr:hypothetical protein Cni_G14331 [Canna indica]